MVTGLILAGGKSERYGSDKALLGGVEKIANAMRDCGFSRVIVLCGKPERMSLFNEECWPDLESCKGVLDVLKWAIEEIDDEIQLAPCDALYLDAETIAEIRGVPVDDQGIRQPLLARLPRKFRPAGRSVNEMMSSIDSQIISKPDKVRNVNFPSDLE